MNKPSYCTQNDGKCLSCPLASFTSAWWDCRGYQLYTVGYIAKTYHQGSERAARKALNANKNLKEHGIVIDESITDPTEIALRSETIFINGEFTEVRFYPSDPPDKITNPQISIWKQKHD